MKARNKFALIAALAALPAHADVYKCVDADGHVTYTNAKGVAKGCKLLSQDQRVSTVPGRTAAAPAGFPKVDGDTQRARDSERRKILERELATEQNQLELAQKELAEQEQTVLPAERNAKTITVTGKDGKPVTQTVPGGTINQAKVQERVQPYRDKVALHERNIEALKKEIGNLR